jgi:ATP-dependent RNA helicase DDX18/HAS1
MSRSAFQMNAALFSALVMSTSPSLRHSFAFQMPTRPETRRLLPITLFDTSSTRERNARQEDYDPFGDFGYYGGDLDDAAYQWDASAVATPNEKDHHLNISDSEPKSHFYSKKTLQDPSFGGSQLFHQLCEGAGITRPSRIQSLAWPVLLRGQHAVIADQTGSGKTLAYLVPLLQRALQSMARDKERRDGSPRLLILAPTAELADQIRAVCDKLSQQVPFKTMVISASGTYATSIRDQIRLIQRQPVDVLISTPGRVATILRTRNSGLDLTSLQAIVLDEVDVLLIDETFGPQLRTVGVAAPVERTQFVFATATLPDSVVETVEKEFPSVVQVRGPGLHRVAPTVTEHLVDVSVPSMYNRDAKLCFDVKAKQLLKTLRKNRCRRTLIFCNTVESCRSVENLLKRNDKRGQIFHVGAYHNAMTPEARNENLAVFARGKDASHSKGGIEDADHVLVCTDRAARGVDFDAAPVDHVVLFDFPRDPAEYVRRVGRTARAGRAGTSTVFAYGWQLPIAKEIIGSKLKSFTVAADEMDDGGEFGGGVKGRRTERRPRQDKDQMIKGNIQGGRLWNDKKG